MLITKTLSKSVKSWHLTSNRFFIVFEIGKNMTKIKMHIAYTPSDRVICIYATLSYICHAYEMSYVTNMTCHNEGIC